jgi:hypothetical protein
MSQVSQVRYLISCRNPVSPVTLPDDSHSGCLF